MVPTHSPHLCASHAHPQLWRAFFCEAMTDIINRHPSYHYTHLPEQPSCPLSQGLPHPLKHHSNRHIHIYTTVVDILLGRFKSLNDVGSLLLGLDVEWFPPGYLNLLLAYLLINHADLSGELGQLLFLDLQLRLNLLPPIGLQQGESQLLSNLTHPTCSQIYPVLSAWLGFLLPRYQSDVHCGRV